MNPDLLTLGFDTSAAHCAAALLRGNETLATRTEEMSKGQAERLMPLLEEVLDEAGYGWADLDVIGVGVGPGNFTGIRIAVSAARGLALSLGIQAIGVSNLQAQVFGIDGITVSTLDARQDHLFLEVFSNGTGNGPHLCKPDDLPAIPAKAEPVCIGYRAEDIVAQVAGEVREPTLPVAEAIARIAQLRKDSTTERPAPLYIRAPDAAPPRDPAPVILP